MIAAASASTIQLYDRQAAFVFDTARYPAFIAGRNSGKTRAGAVKAANRCARPGLGVIAAPTFPMLVHAAKRTFLDELRRRAEIDRRWVFMEHKSERTLSIPAFGSEVLFGSLDNPDSVRGPNFGWGWLDEPGYASDEGWRTLKGSVRDGDDPQLWPTGTPKGRNHWLYREWMVNPDPSHTYHHATSRQNPFVDAATYVAAMGYQGIFYEQEIGGEFVSFEGLVYPAFNRDRHVQRIDCEGWATIIGLDMGTRNPTAILTVRYAGDRVHIEREVYERGLSSDAITDAAVAAYEGSGAVAFVVDPSAAGLIKSLIDRNIPAVKAHNDVLVGISRVTSIIPDLTVDPSCVNTIAEFESYAYPERRTETDAPVKANDHCLIAGTLIETASGLRRIETIAAGDMVMTRNGWRRVIAAGLTNPSVQVYTLRTSDGRTLTGSSLHPIWTDNRGWVFLDSLRYDDILQTWASMWTVSSSMAFDSGDTRTQRRTRSGPTMCRIPGIVSAALAACMRKSGRRITARFRRDMKSITRTGIRSTTTSPTFSVLPLPSIARSTRAILPATRGSRISTLSVLCLLTGIAPPRDARGIANTERGHGKGGNHTMRRVSTAAQPIRRGMGAVWSAFAPTPASPRGVAPAASMTWIERAPNAERSSASIGIRVPVTVPAFVRGVVAEPRRQAVYNLTVEQTQEFFANGILVHNSMDVTRYIAMYLDRRPEIEVFTWAA